MAHGAPKTINQVSANATTTKALGNGNPTIPVAARATAVYARSRRKLKE